MPTCAICFEQISRAGTLQCGHVMDLGCLKAALQTQPRRCPICRAPDDRPPIELYNNADDGPSTSGSGDKPKKSSQRVPFTSPPSPSKPNKTAGISFREISVAVLSADIDDLQKSKTVLEGELGRAQRQVEEARSDKQAYEVQVKRLRKERRALEQAVALEEQRSEAQLNRVNELTLRNDHLETELKRRETRLGECAEDIAAQRRTSLIYQNRAADFEKQLKEAALEIERLNALVNSQSSRAEPAQPPRRLLTKGPTDRSSATSKHVTPRPLSFRQRQAIHVLTGETSALVDSPLSHQSSSPEFQVVRTVSPLPDWKRMKSAKHDAKTPSDSSPLSARLFIGEKDENNDACSSPPKKRGRVAPSKVVSVGGAVKVHNGKPVVALAFGPISRRALKPSKSSKL